MDKVKAQATQLAQKTQEAAQEGKARIDQAQAGRRGDMLLRQLGALVFAERTGRGTPDSPAKIDQLISTISVHEKENGLNLAQPVPPQGSPGDQSGTAPSEPSGQGTSSDPAGGPGGSYQDTPGGFPNAGQTFFPPPEDSESGPAGPR
ncbi:MAG: hypothetical protein ACRDOK_00435 [Streptosporangiaceae bacterium]